VKFELKGERARPTCPDHVVRVRSSLGGQALRIAIISSLPNSLRDNQKRERSGQRQQTYQPDKRD